MGNADEEEKYQAMVVAGNKLRIIANRIGDDEWSLCIENVHRIRTNWCEFFESADDALAAGRRALETDPIEEFISREGFEYLP
jgi:hypothetical protein